MKGLQGIRVLDLSWLLPGPYATMLLADFGADVVKIEQPGRGDYAREMLPDVFAVVNRNKRSMTLDLKVPAGRDVLLRLARDADVLIEGFRPGVMKRLGLDYETLSAINPRLIYCSISGYGQTGPYRNWAGHDIAYVGVGGGYSVPGDIRHPPVKGSLAVGDLSSGMFATIAIQNSLWERLSSGKGRYLDVSITDCVAAWAGVRLANVTWNGLPPTTRLSATNRIFTAGDGKRMSLAISEDPFFVKLCRTLGRQDWLDDPRFRTLPLRLTHAMDLLPELEAILASRPRAEWLAIFEKDDVPAAPVHDAEDVFHDPQLVARDLLWQAPTDGTAPRRMYGHPVKFDADMPRLRNVAPALGADSEAVLAEAGYDAEAIRSLRASGAL